MKVMAVDTKKWTVTAYGSVDLDPAKVQESLENDNGYLAENLKKLLSENLIGKLASTHVVLGVPAGRTFTRTFTVPASSERYLKDAVNLEVEQYVPIPISTLYVDYEVIERSKDELSVLMCAVPRVLIDSCVNLVENAGLRVIMVEPSVGAVARLLESTEDGHLPTVIVDIGSTSTDIAILDRSIRIAGSTAVGGNTFTLDIAKKLKVPLDNAHQLKVLNGLNAGSRQQKITSALAPSLDKMINETQRVMRYYDERIANHRKLEQVLIVGGGANLPGIGEYFTNELVMPARVASPWQKLNFGKLPQPAKHFKSRYITVAGLASINPNEVWG